MKTVFIIPIVVGSVLIVIVLLWLIYRRRVGVEVSVEIEIGGEEDNNNNTDLEAGDSKTEILHNDQASDGDMYYWISTTTLEQGGKEGEAETGEREEEGIVVAEETIPVIMAAVSEAMDMEVKKLEMEEKGGSGAVESGGGGCVSSSGEGGCTFDHGGGHSGGGGGDHFSGGGGGYSSGYSDGGGYSGGGYSGGGGGDYFSGGGGGSMW